MTLDEEYYWELDKMIPQSVNRSLALGDLRAGEPEEAIAMLLNEAFSVIGLPGWIVDFVNSRYDNGPAVDMVNILQEYGDY